MLQRRVLVLLLSCFLYARRVYALTGVKCDTLPTNSFCSTWVGQPFVVNVSGNGFSSLQKFNDNMNLLYNINDDRYRNTAITSMRAFWKCPNWNGSTVRYLGSMMCGSYAKAAQEGCKNNVLLCTDVCKTFLSTIVRLFEDPTQCTQQVNRTSYIQAVKDLCAASSQPCAASIQAEESSCGFYTSSDKAAFCSSNPDQSCCKKESKLSGGAIAGIVIGVLALLLLAALLVYYLKVRRNKRGTQSGGGSYGRNKHLSGTPNPQSMMQADEKAGNAQENFGSDFTITEKTREVWQNFDVRNSDEITLRIGDLVHVENVFTDDWAWGYNLTTRQEGAFPYPCVKELNTLDPHKADRHSSINPTPRASSLYIPRD